MKGDVALEARLHADHCADQKSDDSIVRHHEAGVFSLPRPTRERDAEEVYAEKTKPN